MYHFRSPSIVTIIPILRYPCFRQGSYQIRDPILHIELRRWADVVLIAPCSANTLAKIAGGLCDNLVRTLSSFSCAFRSNSASCGPQTSMLRALASTTPTYLFPAMNTLMYEHPLTAEHLRIVREVIGYNVIGPIGKNLACGDVGECDECSSICAFTSHLFG